MAAGAGALKQLAVQTAAAAAVAALAWPLRTAMTPAQWFGLVACGAGVGAAGAAWLGKQPVWWRFIHLLFLPLAWAVSRFAVDPAWFLGGFALLALVYRGAAGERVPLYLSNAATATRLAGLMRERGATTLADIGAGVGSIAISVARQNAATTVFAVENAPLTWAVGRALVALNRLPNVTWRFGSLWHTDLGRFDMVYAFLSPEPMPALWQKARAEMRPGTLLVSNSFAVPDQEPSAVIAVADRRQTRLFCYVL